MSAPPGMSTPSIPRRRSAQSVPAGPAAAIMVNGSPPAAQTASAMRRAVTIAAKRVADVDSAKRARIAMRGRCAEDIDSLSASRFRGEKPSQPIIDFHIVPIIISIRMIRFHDVVRSFFHEHD
jgi:hypothetical protein